MTCVFKKLLLDEFNDEFVEFVFPVILYETTENSLIANGAITNNTKIQIRTTFLLFLYKKLLNLLNLETIIKYVN